MIFKSQPSYDNKWKEKYLALLDNQDAKEKTFHDNEALLCKTIVRLTLVAKGFDHTLDPHLTRIHSAVKSGLKSAKLKSELEQLTQAVIHLKEADAPPVSASADLLFDFLIRQSSQPTEQRDFELLRKQYNNNEFKSTDELFQALLDVAEPAFVPTTEPDFSETVTNDQIETRIVSQQLLLLLEHLDIPLEFEEQSEQLKVALRQSSSAHSFKPLLDNYVALLVDIKKHIQKEQKNIEGFLSELTEQLNDLDRQVIGTHKVTQQSSLIRNKLDQFVSAQMQDLQNSSASATTLSSLQLLINTRLETITRQIQQHREKEAKYRQQTRHQLDELSNKITQMEKESNDLRNRLTLAHNKALHDTLTGLPNRTAYDERLDMEWSRFKRNKRPLSLVIWDIDHFKHINDNFGHKAGDKTLKIIAQLLSAHCRDSDFVSRFGGEEFTMLLPETDAASALTLTNKLRTLIEKSRFNAGGQSLSITLSCGISEFKEDDQPEAVFERADQALYEAKKAGRNQCLTG